MLNPSLLNTDESITNAEQRLKEVSDKISKLNSKQRNVNVPAKNDAEKFDWTRSYQAWANYEDIDELEQMKKQEESKISSLLGKKDILGHTHDHNKEREFFELPEKEKFQQMELYFFRGLHLLDEGNYLLASEKFEVAIAYYEYCFPDSNDEENLQEKLDSYRLDAWCCLSYCLVQRRKYRDALDYATRAINEDSQYVVALLRRAQAYRCLDEYELALTDIDKALSQYPDDFELIEELQLIQKLQKGYESMQKSFAKSMIQGNTEKSKAVTDGEIDIEIPTTEIYSNEHSIFNDYVPLEPLIPAEVQAIHQKILELD